MSFNASDNFNRSNAALDNSSLSGGTYTWDVKSGAPAIVSNQLSMPANTQIAVLDPDPAEQDHYAQVDQVSIPTGPCARYAGTTNYYMARIYYTGDGSNAALQVYKIVGGSATSLGSYACPGQTAGTIKLECDGIDPGSISTYLDGTLRIGPVNGDNALDAGNVGVRCSNASATAIADNFVAGTLGGAPATVYYPNSTSCGAWTGTDADNPPDALADAQDTDYDSGELDKVSADDENYKDKEPPEGGQVAMHALIFTIEDFANAVTVTPSIEVGDVEEGSTAFSLYAWDGAEFDLIDSETNGAPGTKVTLGAAMSAATYVNGSGEVNLLVTITSTAATIRNWYDVLTVSYGLGGAPLTLVFTTAKTKLPNT